MNMRTTARRYRNVIVAVTLSLSFASLADAGDPFLVASRGGVEVWSIPEASPGFGLKASTIELRSVADKTMGLFYNPGLTGEVHQTWLEGPFGRDGTGSTSSFDPLITQDQWRLFDSHILPTIGSHRGEGRHLEENDGSTTAQIGNKLARVERHFGDGTFSAGALTGFGDLYTTGAEPAIYLHREFTNTYPLARVVGCNVWLSVAVGGQGIDPAVADFGGFNELSVQVQHSNGLCPVPEPTYSLHLHIVVFFPFFFRITGRLH